MVAAPERIGMNNNWYSGFFGTIKPAELKNFIDDFVVLDTETTGLGSNAEIVQIAVVDKTGVILNSLVKPTVPVDKAASAVHGIDEDALKDAPSWYNVRRDLLRVIAGRNVMIYNAEFDCRMLRQTDRAQVGNNNYPIDWKTIAAWYDVMGTYAEMHGSWSDYHGNWSYVKLVTVAKHYRVQFDNAHNAADDALMTYHVIMKMHEELNVEYDRTDDDLWRGVYGDD